ncbi:HEAT repeat domain-containing protein [Candidatus Eisenbacteria bacterium]|uniref:HEAT repeat domain-containing protein n=1 Tax=Eiseniibacteriota bacterium TaxID=2212470 RepID=A0ABV6YLC9_UNCEI
MSKRPHHQEAIRERRLRSVALNFTGLLLCAGLVVLLAGWHPSDDYDHRRSGNHHHDRHQHSHGHHHPERNWDVPATRSLHRDLHDADDVVTRQLAAWWLGEHEEDRSVDPLIDALDDRAADVRLVAAWALGEIKDSDAIDPLSDRLEREREPFVREMLVLSLGEIDDRLARGVLRQIRDEDPELRDAAEWALYELSDRENDGVWAGEEKRLDDLRDIERQLKGQNIDDIDFEITVDELLQHLRSTSAEERRKAALLLGAAGLAAAYESLEETEEAVKGLLAALQDPEPEVRAQAIWSLDEINPSRW